LEVRCEGGGEEESGFFISISPEFLSRLIFLTDDAVVVKTGLRREGEEDFSGDMFRSERNS